MNRITSSSHSPRAGFGQFITNLLHIRPHSRAPSSSLLSQVTHVVTFLSVSVVFVVAVVFFPPCVETSSKHANSYVGFMRGRARATDFFFRGCFFLTWEAYAKERWQWHSLYFTPKFFVSSCRGVRFVALFVLSFLPGLHVKLCDHETSPSPGWRFFSLQIFFSARMKTKHFKSSIWVSLRKFASIRLVSWALFRDWE